MSLRILAGSQTCFIIVSLFIPSKVCPQNLFVPVGQVPFSLFEQIRQSILLFLHAWTPNSSILILTNILAIFGIHIHKHFIFVVKLHPCVASSPFFTKVLKLKSLSCYRINIIFVPFNFYYLETKNSVFPDLRFITVFTCLLSMKCWYFTRVQAFMYLIHNG